MTQSKVIWIINNYASHLETRHLELARQFAENGYTTAVITSSYHHGRREYMYAGEYVLQKRAENVFFVYLKAKPEYAGNGAKRVLNMLNFCRIVEKHQEQLCRDTGKPDFIIGSSAHPFVWETAYRLAKKHNAKFIAEFRDIWPLSLVQIQGVSPTHPFVLLMSAVEKRAYKRADAIVGTMPFAYKHLEDLGYSTEKYYWMPNGINTETVDSIVRSGQKLSPELEDYLSSHWCCVYVGSIVKSECMDYIIDAWKLVGQKDLYMAIVGEGAERDHIQQRIDEEQIPNIKMFPAVKPDEVPLILAKAKCCTAALGFGKVGEFGLSKYKLNDYLYSGKPTVFACDGPNIVRDAGHFSVSAEDPQAMADAIVRISTLSEEELAELKEKGQALIRKDYAVDTIGRKYIEMLESL